MELMTRSMAALQGIRRYFTGQPCKYGHVAERFTSSGGCVVCANPLHRSVRNQVGDKIINVPLAVPHNFTEEHREILRKWLQEVCLPPFVKGCTPAETPAAQ